MKKIFEIPEITKLSLVTEKVTVGDVDDYWGVEQGSGDLGANIPLD